MNLLAAKLDGSHGLSALRSPESKASRFILLTDWEMKFHAASGREDVLLASILIFHSRLIFHVLSEER